MYYHYIWVKKQSWKLNSPQTRWLRSGVGPPPPSCSCCVIFSHIVQCLNICVIHLGKRICGTLTEARCWLSDVLNCLKLRDVISVLSACVFQVYLILASQLLVTTAIVAVFTFVWVYRVCVLCACLCPCFTLLTVRLFLTANLSDILYRGTLLSTGHHSKSHSVVTSLPLLKLCALFRSQTESFVILILLF